jgi:hypothetical protein
MNDKPCRDLFAERSTNFNDIWGRYQFSMGVAVIDDTVEADDLTELTCLARFDSRI